MAAAVTAIDVVEGNDLKEQQVYHAKVRRWLACLIRMRLTSPHKDSKPKGL
jgi:hypothetical protein